MSSERDLEGNAPLSAFFREVINDGLFLGVDPSHQGPETYRKTRDALVVYLESLSPNDAAESRMELNTLRLTEEAHALKTHPMRRDQSVQHYIQSVMNRQPVEEQERLLTVINAYDVARLQGNEGEMRRLEQAMPERADLLSRLHDRMATTELLKTAGKSCLPQYMMDGFLRWEWNDPELNFNEYAAVTDHLRDCLTCTTTFLKQRKQHASLIAEKLGRRQYIETVRSGIRIRHMLSELFRDDAAKKE